MLQKIAIMSLISLVGLTIASCALRPVTEPHRIDPANEPTPVPTSVVVSKPTYTVARGTVTRQIALSGQVVPVSEMPLSLGLTGQVAALFVDRGAEVSEGDLLATLDTSDYESQLQLAQSVLAVSQARLDAVELRIANDRRLAEIALEAAQLNLAFVQERAGANPSAEDALTINLLSLDVERAEITLSELASETDPALSAEVAQNQLRVDELNDLIARSSLIAPANGTVLRIRIDEGETAPAGETIMVIADLSQLEVRAIVANDADMDKLLEGQSTTVSPTGRPGETVDGIIRLLPPPYGNGDNLEEGTIRVDIGDGTTLENGDRLTVDLLLAENEDVLWLPPAAVREFKGRYFVVVQTDEFQQRIDVKIGLENSDQVEITEGVTEGDTIIGP